MTETDPPEAPRQPASTLPEILQLAREAVAGGSGAAREIDALPARQRLAAIRDLELDISLKRRYARVLLWLLGGQLAVADGVFIAYAQVGAHWKLSTSVINGWLGATLIEVVGIVLVVTRYLFPRRDTQP